MTSLLIDPPLPNHFKHHDTQDERITALEDKVQKQQIIIETLVQSVGLLMRAENIRLDRKSKT